MRQETRKLFDCGDYVYGGTGDLADTVIIAQWLRDGAVWEDRPELDDVENGCCGIVVRKADACLFILNGNRPVLCEMPPQRTAVGSGSTYAVAAMVCGRTAIEAVEVAAQFDDATGLGRDWVDVLAGRNG